MHKQIIIMRDDLNMRKGKMIAQGAHASMAALLNASTKGDAIVTIPLDMNIGPWLENSFTKICVRITGQDDLEALVQKAKDAGIPCSIIKDNGKTEFNGVATVTCGAIGPAPADVVDAITAHLKLF